MATSGTVGQTTFDTATAIEHAFRRVKVHPSKQTPETIAIAKENLYLLLTNLSNRGLNLWRIQQRYVGLEEAQAIYACPTGTIDLLNLIYTQPTRVTGTDTTTTTSVATELTSSTEIVRVGIRFATVSASGTLTISSSPDGVTWTTIHAETRADWGTGTWYWNVLDPAVTDLHFKAAFSSAATFDEFYLASQAYDLPVTQWSRDTFSVINNKSQQGRPSTCYYFEKLTTPQVTLWPVPDNSYDHLTMFVHLQVQDVGALTDTLDIPARWFEAVVWQLAARLAFELPGVDPQLTTLIVQMADKYTLEAEDEEADGAPLYLTPGIGVYTR